MIQECNEKNPSNVKEHFNIGQSLKWPQRRNEGISLQNQINISVERIISLPPLIHF